MKGRSLELYFIDGKPDGMLTAEVFNWTGHVLVTPRTQISEALARKEARYTGVYLLLGDKEGEPLAYIGEAEDISDRIRSHDARRDWWRSRGPSGRCRSKTVTRRQGPAFRRLARRTWNHSSTTF